MSLRPLDGPWGYASEAIAHIEEHNCSRGHGCTRGAARGSDEWKEIGPGGSCMILCRIFLDPDKPIEELDYDGGATHPTCWEYEPRPAPPPPRPKPEPIPEGQLTLDDA